MVYKGMHSKMQEKWQAKSHFDKISKYSIQLKMCLLKKNVRAFSSIFLEFFYANIYNTFLKIKK